MTFLVIALVAMFSNIGAQASNSKQHRVRVTKVHHTAKNLIFTSVSNTIEPKDIVVIHDYNFTKNIVKNYSKHNGVNCSFFDPKTLKVFGVLITDKEQKLNTIFNRPTLVLTKDNKAYVAKGNITTLENIKYAVGAGGYLIMNGKVNVSTDTHFTNDFLRLQVNRTVVIITTDDKLKFATYRNRSPYSIANSLSKDSNVKTALFFDGGSSSQNKNCNSGRRIPVSIIY